MKVLWKMFLKITDLILLNLLFGNKQLDNKILIIKNKNYNNFYQTVLKSLFKKNFNNLPNKLPPYKHYN